MKKTTRFKIKWKTKFSSDLNTNKYILIEIELQITKKKCMKNNKSEKGDNGDVVGGGEECISSHLLTSPVSLAPPHSLSPRPN